MKLIIDLSFMNEKSPLKDIQLHLEAKYFDLHLNVKVF